VVALTHLSMSEDKEVARCADVDVIIGGHEHSLLESSSGGAPIFKMNANASEVGQIDLNISKASGVVESIDWKVIPVTDQIKEDPRFNEWRFDSRGRVNSSRNADEPNRAIDTSVQK